MSVFNDVIAALQQSFTDIWFGTMSFIPLLVIAILVFAIGWVLGALVQRIVEGIFDTLKVDSALKSAGLEEVVHRSGYTLRSGVFVGAIIKWFIMVAFLVAAFNVLGLNDVNVFLSGVVLAYIPQVLIAVLVLMVAVVIGDALSKLVVASARAAHIKSASLLGKITRWAIWIFAILTALVHLQVASGIIYILIEGLVLAVAVAVALAFGLGSKEVAGEIVKKVWHQISEKE